MCVCVCVLLLGDGDGDVWRRSLRATPTIPTIACCSLRATPFTILGPTLGFGLLNTRGLRHTRLTKLILFSGGRFLARGGGVGGLGAGFFAASLRLFVICVFCLVFCFAPAGGFVVAGLLEPNEE